LKAPAAVERPGAWIVVAINPKNTNGARKRKPKPLKLGKTAAEVYALAEKILSARDWLTDGRAQAERLLALGPSPSGTPDGQEIIKGVWGAKRDRLGAALEMFERRLVIDPTEAVGRVDALRSMPLLDIRNAGGGGDPVLKAALRLAVERVDEWLRQRGSKPSPRRRLLEYVPAAVAALQPIAVGFPTLSLADLEAAAAADDVVRCLKGPRSRTERTGYRAAAEIIVERITGQSQSTIRRASGSIRAAK
jgi:hypothetical protein